jgi:hypothetical protein
MSDLPLFNITRASDYEDGAAGFVIEQLGFWTTDRKHYAIPAWEERGLPQLAERFPTMRAAQAALDEATGRR